LLIKIIHLTIFVIMRNIVKIDLFKYK